METLLKINTNKYSVAETGTYNTENPKTQIILSFSLRSGNNYIIRKNNYYYRKSKKWNTFTITRDGDIHQHYNPKKHSDFIGIKEVDIKSISIVIENMGFLIKDSNDKYKNHLNEVCDDDRVVEMSYLGFNYWELIDENQINGCLELCSYLCDEFNIKKNIIDFHLYHKDSIKHKGILFLNNYFENVINYNPLFNIENFQSKLIT